MVWRCRWKFLKQFSYLTKPFPSPPCGHRHRLSSAAASATHIDDSDLMKKKCRTVLTPLTVNSTLLNCHSDLISLAFFLWSARRRNYFHDRPAFDHMAHILPGLTNRLGSVKLLLLQLNILGFATKPQVIFLLLRIYWHGGMHNLVFETFQEMLNHGYTPNTYARNILMDALFKTGLVTVALRVFRETQYPNFLTYSIAICNLCRLNDPINVRNVLRTMLRNGYYLNSNTFPMVLNCFCKSKMGSLKDKWALQLYALMITLGIPISVQTWSILIHGFCKSGKLVMAGYILEKMVEAGCPPNVVTYTSLIKGFMESQMHGDALDVYKTMISAPDLLLCNVLIDCLSKMGRYDDALEVFVNLHKRKLVPDSYTFCSIISVVCLSKQFDLLPKLISGLPVQVDLVVCNSILGYLCETGSPYAAVEFYNNMVDRGFIPDNYTYCGLLRGLCGAGRIEEAVNVYRGILMNNNGIDAHVHTVILNGLIKSGNFHKGLKLFREAILEKYPPLDVVSYTVAVSGLLRAGRCEEAYALYSQMKEGGIAPNAKTFNVLVSGFCRERDVEMVQQILCEMIDAGMELDLRVFNRIKHFLS